MAESVEVVIFGDCMGEDGESFLRGERRVVSKQIYRQLVSAGRVCMSDEAMAAAEAELASRSGAPAPEPEKKAKGKAEA